MLIYKCNEQNPCSQRDNGGNNLYSLKNGLVSNYKFHGPPSHPNGLGYLHSANQTLRNTHAKS